MKMYNTEASMQNSDSGKGGYRIDPECFFFLCYTFAVQGLVESLVSFIVISVKQ